MFKILNFFSRIVFCFSVEKKMYELNLLLLQYLPTREFLPFYLNALNIRWVWVEIGVQRGFFSFHILRFSNLKKLYSVDPWRSFKKNNYIDRANVNNFRQLINFFITCFLLFPFGKRSKIFRKTSIDSVKYIPEALDFVYIDWDHSYKAVKQDMLSWWPKISSWWVMAGHDYVDGRLFESDFGVKKAVDEFVSENNLELVLTKERDYPSWIIHKP